MNGETLMQESKTYQYLREKFLREATIENTLALIKRRFHTEGKCLDTCPSKH